MMPTASSLSIEYLSYFDRLSVSQTDDCPVCIRSRVDERRFLLMNVGWLAIR